VGSPLHVANQALPRGVRCLHEPLEPRLLLAATAGLVGYWPFESADVSGTTVVDRSNYGRPGTLVGGPAVVRGRVGGAVSFDGVDDGARVGTVLPTGAGRLTVTAWVFKRDATSDAAVISTAPASSPLDFTSPWSLDVVGAAVRVRLGSGTAAVAFDGPQIRVNRWEHVAFTYDGSAVRIYLNGRLRAGRAHATGVPLSDRDVSIGQSGDGPGGRFFNGLLDEVRVYNNALHSRSLRNLFSRRPPVATRGAFPTIPSTPGDATAIAVSPTRIDLSWADTSGNEAGFKVEQSGDGVNWALAGTVGAGVRGYAVTGLTPSTTYHFRVRASNAAGDSPYSDTATTATMPTSAPPTSPPATPYGLTATAASSRRIKLTWMDNSMDEAGFKIQRSLDGVTWAQVAVVGPGDSSYNVGGLSPSTAYQFRVRAYNSAGDSANTDPAGATTTDVPPWGDRPGPANTGPRNPGALQPLESLVISEEGAVVENVDVNGIISINANNVTIRNFRVNAGGADFAIRIDGDATGTVLEDGEVTNFAEAVCYKFTDYTARRLNVHHGQRDGFKAEGNVLIEGCWVHYLGMAPGAHADGVQSSKGGGMIFRGNNFDLPWDVGVESTSAFMIKSDFGPINDVLIEGNWLNGGQFTIYVTEGSFNGEDHAPPTDVRILNNRFGRDNQYGPYYPGTATTVRQGNVWDDTGELVDE
jgi:hypothetical protein